MKFREATSEIVRLLAREAWPVRGDPEDYDPLLDQIGDAAYVLIGEASHGTGAGCALVGFSTYDGTVTAARDWHQPSERRHVRPARPESVEGLLHEVGEKAFTLTLRSGEGRHILYGSFLERAIGVVYRPETELMSHYLEARPARQFDAIVHIDHTRAVEPLERSAVWETGEVPETYPTGV